jgi:hypothetical protein
LLLRILRNLADLRTVRGRQALVENALGGYPKSAQLLGNLEWEGSATVFVSDLLRWFGGYELTEGIEALPLLVNAIAPLVSAADRAALIELRQRQFRNQGSSMIAILRELETRGPEILKTLTIQP